MALAGCGGSGTTTGGGGTGSADSIGWSGLLDGIGSDAAGPDSSDQSAGTDAGQVSDGGAGDAAPSDGDAAVADANNCEFATNPAAGQPGASCKANTDCASQACVEGPDGKICTRPCDACCPQGYGCSPFGVTSGDQTYVCLPKTGSLCRPCTADSACAAFAPGSLCVGYLDDEGSSPGAFCGLPCAVTADCPAEYACADAIGEKTSAKQCVHVSGQCACNATSISDGADTICADHNVYGTCTGTRKCAIGGLTACSASTPSQEVCGNSKDEDCDGTTDDPGALGCADYYADADGDGTGALGAAKQCLCGPTALYSAPTATDCDDAVKTTHPGAKEICNDADDDCDGVIDNGCDDDGDGWCDDMLAVLGAPTICANGKGDCNDAQPGVHPQALEACGNGFDDDCDGQTDAGAQTSGCVPFYIDEDADKYGTGEPKCQCAAAGLYAAVTPNDCDDADPGVNPGAAEVCGNIKDDNCSGASDEAGAKGCVQYYTDADNDGYGVGAGVCLCAAAGLYETSKGGDCDDASTAIYPGATEICDGLDNNCSGGVDEADANGCTTYFADEDSDTYGNAKINACLCAADLAHPVTDSSDCNDQKAQANPGIAEVCDGTDNNCDGATDEPDAADCTAYYVDGDGDGYGVTNLSACLCAANEQYKALNSGDCKDNVISIHPGVEEKCGDLTDNDCDGLTDEADATGCTTFYYDGDVDGHGDGTKQACLCKPTGNYTSLKGGDCQDDVYAVHPAAEEVCDGLDNDCDGSTDPANSSDCKAFYVDKDGDGYGTTNFASKCLCGGSEGVADKSGDCDDDDKDVHPAATEICNGKDDNCDGSKDPKNTSDCTTYYADGDGDGYGVTGLTQCACKADALYKALLPADCNDGAVAIHPDATETCNGVDDNCNITVDEGLLSTWYNDSDGDGWGSALSTIQCKATGAYTATTSGDCDDLTFAVHPGATEVCNQVDDNCTGGTDEGTGAALYYVDSDGDGFGAGGGQMLCAPTGQYTVVKNGDCDDAKSLVYPQAPEICDALDNGCDGFTDEGLPTNTYFLDSDHDNYGTGAGAAQCGPFGLLTASLDGDCEDGNSDVHPNAMEICNNLDDNCAGGIDDGLPKVDYFLDGDSDQYGTGAAVPACAGFGAYTALVAGDCNDGNPGIRPGAAETCGNGVDENCSGGADEGCCSATTFYNFENGSSAGWTLQGDWHVANSITAPQGSWSLQYTDPVYVNQGYNGTSGKSATTSILIPTGSASVKVDIYWNNYGAYYYYDTFWAEWTYGGFTQDDVMSMKVNFGGAISTVGPYTDNHTGKLVSLTLPVSPGQWGTSVSLAFTVSSPSNYLPYYIDVSQAGIAVDNIRATCN